MVKKIHETNTVLSNTSIVVCSQNSGAFIAKSLESLLELGVREIIVVDGKSTDQSAQVYDSLRLMYPRRLRVLTRTPLGLADARQFGNDNSIGDFILHCGPDNIIGLETIVAMIEELKESNFVSCRTRLSNGVGYLNKSHNFSKKRFRPGRNLEVVGTPYIASSKLFRIFPFNPEMKHSDDTELCERLRAAGMLISRVENYCLEIGFDNLKTVFERWSRWGGSDATFYRYKKNSWTIRRKIVSLLHPIQAELVAPASGSELRPYLSALPFLLMVTFFRYVGWVRSSFRAAQQANH